MISRTDNHDIYVTSNNTIDVENDDFEAKVLHYLQMNHPTHDLNALLEKLKILSPNSPMTMATINKSMNITNAKMRDNPTHKEYSEQFFSQKVMQLTGTNTLYNNMIYEIFFSADEERLEIEKW